MKSNMSYQHKRDGEPQIDYDQLVKRELNKLKKYVRWKRHKKVKEWLESENLPTFYVKLSNCKVIDYQTNLFRSPFGEIEIPLKVVKKFVSPTRIEIYWLDKQGVLNICKHWLEYRDQISRTILLFILPSSSCTRDLDTFLQIQLSYFA
ncbi:MAG: hypothetical protein ACFFC7_16490 [Candidatus Hermodarchaeota archaeon]